MRSTVVRRGAAALLAVLLSLDAAPSRAASCSAGASPSTARIVRFGDETIDRWPGFAAIRRKLGGAESFFCGATAIAPQWLVTAAHCVDAWKRDADGGYVDSEGWKLEAVLGTEDLDLIPSTGVFQPREIIIHEGYRQVVSKGRFLGLDNDIALIKLDRPWEGPLAPVGAVAAASTLLRVAGFGIDVRQGSGVQARVRASDGTKYYAGSQRLKVATVPQVPLRRCKAAYSEATIIGDRQICAGSIWQGEDSCNGDSGGPLMTPEPDSGCPYLVGVVSWGPERCGAPEKYGVYTRLSEFVSWIHAKSGVAIKVRETRALSLSDQQKELLDQLDKTLRPVSGRLDVYIPGQGRLKSGQFFHLTVDSAVDGRLILIDIRPTGVIRQIVPNTFSKGPVQIEASSPVRVPNKRVHGFEAFQAEAAGGRGRIVAIVVPETFAYDAAVKGPQALAGGAPDSKIIAFDDKTGTAYLTSLVDQVLRNLPADKTGKASGWAYGTVDYRYVD